MKKLLFIIACVSLIVGCKTVSHSNNTDDVYWLITAAIKDGQLENVKSINKELVSATLENEPMTLSYDWSVSEDGKTCYFFEWYDNSEAVMIHTASFGEKFAEAHNASADVEATARCFLELVRLEVISKEKVGLSYSEHEMYKKIIWKHKQKIN